MVKKVSQLVGVHIVPIGGVINLLPILSIILYICSVMKSVYVQSLLSLSQRNKGNRTFIDYGTLWWYSIGQQEVLDCFCMVMV